MWKKAWSDPVWSKVIAAAIIGAVGTAATFFLGWWPAISGGLISMWRFLLGSAELSRWVVLLMAMLSLPTLVLLVGLLWAAIRPNAPLPSPNWTSYRSDVFLGLRWRWSYNGNEMSEPMAFCPTCDYQIHPNHGFDYGSYSLTEFRCDSCSKAIASFKVSYSELTSKVTRLAQMKIRNGSWAAKGGT